MSSDLLKRKRSVDSNDRQDEQTKKESATSKKRKVNGFDVEIACNFTIAQPSVVDIDTLQEISQYKWSREECYGALQKNEHDITKAYLMLDNLYALLLDDDVDEDAKKDVQAALAELEKLGKNKMPVRRSRITT